MRVQLDGESGIGFQLRDQAVGVLGKQHAGHILNANRIGAQRFDFLRHLDKILDRVNRARRVTERNLAMTAVAFGSVDYGFHVS